MNSRTSTHFDDAASTERWVPALIGVTLVGRILLGGSLGLGVDESYTVATSRAFALSTYDHPPLAWWLTGAARWLFGTEAPLAVRAPFILLFALTTWLMFALTRLLFGERAGLYAALTLNLAPVLAWTSGTFVLPDGPLLAALLAGAYCVARVLFIPGTTPAWWLAAGACGGLACLSKLHGIFLFAGTGLFLLTVPSQRRWLFTPWPYLGAAIACVMFLPVIAWNIQHDWVSFAFQGARARISHFDLVGPLRALAGQALFLLPWLWVPLVISLGRSLITGRRDERGWLIACLAVGPIAVFTLVALSGNRVLFHWAAPGYLFAFALLGRDLTQKLATSARLTRVWLGATAGSLIAILAAVIIMARLPWPSVALAGRTIPYPLIETVSWAELKQELGQRGLLTQPNTFIATHYWHEAARIDAALGGRPPVRCLCDDARGYGVIYRNNDHAGQDAIIITQGGAKAKLESAYGSCFASIEELPSAAISQGGKPLVQLRVYLGRRFLPQGNSAVCGDGRRR